MGEDVLELGKGETAIVGYGSLLSPASVGRTLQREYGGPFLLGEIEDWRRSWDVSMPNEAFYYEEDGERIYPERILYLNARHRRGERMNCSIFVARENELPAMHAREWIYRPTVVTDFLRGVRLEGGDAIMYVGRPEHVMAAAESPREAAVRKSYLALVDRALDKMSADFRRTYLETTDRVPRHLVIEDHLDPERPSPWEAAGHAYKPER